MPVTLATLMFVAPTAVAAASVVVAVSAVPTGADHVAPPSVDLTTWSRLAGLEPVLS